MRRTRYLFYIPQDQQGNPKEWYTPPQDIWSIRRIPLRMYFNIVKTMCIGVLLILVGLPVTPISFMVRWPMVLRPLCSRVYPRILILADFGTWYKSIR